MSEELLPYDSERLSARILDDMVRAAKEKAGIAEVKTPRRLHRPAVLIIAIIAALSLFAVTAGALLKWDIFSLFRSQRENAQNAAGEISSELTDRKRTFLDNINIPEGAEAFPEYTEREYEILAELAHEADMTFDYGDKTLHISGYVFDGSCLDIYYDVTYPDTDTEFYFYSDDTLTASAAVPYLLYTDGNIAYYRSRNYLQLAEGIKSTEIIIGNSDTPPDDNTQNSFIVDVSSIEPVVIEDIELNEGVHLNRFVLSPLGAFMELSESIEYIQTYDSNAYPIYVTYENGNVIDLSDYTGNFEGGAGYLNEEGRIVLDYTIGRNMNIFDIEQIRSVQIFNEVIKIS
ncbi:MAG: hypothetical protein J6O50_05015 [Ruminiclostridium sp.]|nr:hypothetical protein [Ruminiclostridium sp.]